MIEHVIVPDNTLFAISVRCCMNKFKIEQYNTLREYWVLRLRGVKVGCTTYNDVYMRD